MRYVRNNIPVPSTPLVGREQEIGIVVSYVRQPHARLVTLVGPGGVGKTRVALASADVLQDDFADGVCFVPLAAVKDGAALVPTIAQTPGIAETADQPLAEGLGDWLYAKRMLLALDNLEQLRANTAALVPLLERSVGLNIITTSRERLHLRAEQMIEIGGLALPDHDDASEQTTASSAVQLFIQWCSRRRCPRNTSRQCNTCGCIDQRNRPGTLWVKPRFAVCSVDIPPMRISMRPAIFVIGPVSVGLWHQSNWARCKPPA